MPQKTPNKASDKKTNGSVPTPAPPVDKSASNKARGQLKFKDKAKLSDKAVRPNDVPLRSGMGSIDETYRHDTLLKNTHSWKQSPYEEYDPDLFIPARYVF